MKPTILDDMIAEFFRALRPPPRTARGRAAALVRARVALIRSRTRVVVAQTAVIRARMRVDAAQAVVARARRAVARARTDVQATAMPTHNQETAQ
jgi:hypothetical protein